MWHSLCITASQFAVSLSLEDLFISLKLNPEYNVDSPRRGKGDEESSFPSYYALIVQARCSQAGLFDAMAKSQCKP
jgi:hypothetical protein